MAKTYTCNQTSAIATALSVLIWSILALGITNIIGEQIAIATAIFSILTIIGWIIIPLYFKLVRSAFLVGIVIAIIALIGLIAMPGKPAWYMFTAPVFSLSYIVVCITLLACIYFSYESYKELK